MWLGKDLETDKHILAFGDNVYRSRTIRRLAEEERWDYTIFREMTALPWGSAGQPLEDAGAIKQRYITKAMVAKFGATEGCPACAGKKQMQHSSRCRKRFDKILEERESTLPKGPVGAPLIEAAAKAAVSPKSVTTAVPSGKAPAKAASPKGKAKTSVPKKAGGPKGGPKIAAKANLLGKKVGKPAFSHPGGAVDLEAAQSAAEEDMRPGPSEDVMDEEDEVVPTGEEDVSMEQEELTGASSSAGTKSHPVQTGQAQRRTRVKLQGLSRTKTTVHEDEPWSRKVREVAGLTVCESEDPFEICLIYEVEDEEAEVKWVCSATIDELETEGPVMMREPKNDGLSYDPGLTYEEYEKLPLSYFEGIHDYYTGELLPPEEVKVGRLRELKQMVEFTVYMDEPESILLNKGAKKIRSKWIDARRKGGVRSRLVGQEIAWSIREDTFAGTLSVKAVRLIPSLAAT